jgi:ribosomal subunit interface protein
LAISITVRHGTAPDNLEEFTNEKCAGLAKFLRAEARLEFVLEKGKQSWTGEAILHGSRHHERLVAHDSHADSHGCVERLVDKLERQLERNKERRKDHRPAPGSAGEPGPAPDETADEPTLKDVVRGDADGPERRKK